MPADNVKLFSLLFALGRRMRDEKQHYSMLHFQTLRFIKDQGNPSIHEVAQFLCVSRPAATLLIEGLVRDNLVARSLSEKDRRTVQLALTKTGTVFLSRGVRARMKKIGELFSALSPQERRALIAILEKVVQYAEGVAREGKKK